MKQHLLRVFSNPWIGILGTVCSIVGIPLAVYLAQLTNVSPNLTFQVHPVRTPIVTPSQTSNLHVSYKTIDIAGAVTALQLAFWNSGNQPIRAQDILSPLQFELEKHGGAAPRILEATIRKRSRDVTGIVLDESKMEAGIVGVSWNVLETGDGAAIQVVYAGDTNQPLTAKGTIIGQRSLEEVKIQAPVTRLDPLAAAANNKRGNWFIALLTAILIAGIFIVDFFSERGQFRFRRSLKHLPESELEQARVKMKNSFVRMIYAVVIGTAIGAYALYEILHIVVPGPPFGF